MVLELTGEVPRGALWVSSTGTVVILILARLNGSKEVNEVVMECYFRSKPVNENGVPMRGYSQRMFHECRR